MVRPSVRCSEKRGSPESYFLYHVHSCFCQGLLDVFEEIYVRHVRGVEQNNGGGAPHPKVVPSRSEEALFLILLCVGEGVQVNVDDCL